MFSGKITIFVGKLPEIMKENHPMIDYIMDNSEEDDDDSNDFEDDDLLNDLRKKLDL